MTYRQLVWRTYWRNCVFWFALTAGGGVSIMALESSPDSYKVWVLPVYFVGLIAAMCFSFKLIKDWVREGVDKIVPPPERPKPEDFIWNHPWPVALKHLAFNLLVAVPGIIGGFVAFACTILGLTLAPVLTGYWLLPKLLGPIGESSNWLWTALLMPFSFLSCCGLSILFVIGFVFDERMKTNPAIT